MQPQAKPPLTFDEYLILERRAETRSEYVDGEVFAMAGATLRHNEIVGNVFVALRRQLRSRGCGVYTSDLRVWIPAESRGVYPDVVVVCGEPDLYDEADDTLLNPNLLVEVLSSSTEGADRGDKFAGYRTLPSLTDYVLISQKRVLVEHFVRQGAKRWLLTSATRLDEGIEIRSLDARLELADVYATSPTHIGRPPPPTLSEMSGVGPAGSGLGKSRFPVQAR